MQKYENIINLIKEQSPLIHCITNPVSMNDCANIILGLGAKPIMAEHPKEVADITGMSDALGINIGCITDSKMEAIMISGLKSLESNIPTVIDLVGITCSKLRYDFAIEFINKARPSIIKGNLAEIKTLCGLNASYKGIDSNELINQGIDNETKEAIKKLATDTNATIVASGATDFISDGKHFASLANGSKYMPLITGTGCMLNAIIATFLSTINKDTNISTFDIGVISTLYLNTCGELAEKSNDFVGSGTYHIKLLDMISTLTFDKLDSSLINFI